MFWKKRRIIISTVLAIALLLLGKIACAAAQDHYVAPGESLWLIAGHYGTTADQLAQANGIPVGNPIYPGQVLMVPPRIHTVHTVCPGETMWLIAGYYNIGLAALIAANPGVSPQYIYPGQQLNLPANGPTDLPSRGGRVSSSFTPGEIDLLARLVHAEAAGEPYTGLVAVAATVLNRISSSLYPNSLTAVIYQTVQGLYQYSPVLDGRINSPANGTDLQAVYDALAGWDPSGGALGFYNPAKTSNQWVRRQGVTTIIGNHIFFR